MGTGLGPTIKYVQSRIKRELGTEVVFYGTSKHAQRGFPIELYHQWGTASLASGVTTVSGVSKYATSIGPGYDYLGANHNPRRTGTRYNTSRYESAWNYAISHKSRVVAIETWNEYIESTSIAPTYEYGSIYTAVTKVKADALHRIR